MSCTCVHLLLCCVFPSCTLQQFQIEAIQNYLMTPFYVKCDNFTPPLTSERHIQIGWWWGVTKRRKKRFPSLPEGLSTHNRLLLYECSVPHMVGAAISCGTCLLVTAGAGKSVKLLWTCLSLCLLLLSHETISFKVVPEYMICLRDRVLYYAFI